MDMDGAAATQQANNITQTQKSVPFETLTIELLDKLPPREIFATGICVDNRYGINMTGSGKQLRWVACTGLIGDWSVYCHWSDKSPFWIQQHGDKVRHTALSNVIQFDSGAQARYRR
jgi:hypothetical protein